MICAPITFAYLPVICQLQLVIYLKMQFLPLSPHPWPRTFLHSPHYITVHLSPVSYIMERHFKKLFSTTTTTSKHKPPHHHPQHSYNPPHQVLPPTSPTTPHSITTSTSTCTTTQFDYLFKIVLVGDTGVGKSALLLRFSDNTFHDDMLATIGVDFRIRTMVVDGKTIKLQIWDSAGQERFRSLTSSYYRGAHAVAIVFDMSSFNSIEAVTQTWIHEVNTHCPSTSSRLLVGNKCDLVDKREISHQHAIATANSFDMMYIETSAKTARNVHQAFENIVRDLVKR